MGLNAQCTLVYDLPEGHNYKTFRTLCGYDSSCDTDNGSSSGTTMEFLVYVTKEEAYVFDLTTLGYAADEEVPLHDIWENADLGTVKGVISTVVPSHGVRLFRLGNNTSDPTGIESMNFHVEGASGGPARAQGIDDVFDITGRHVGISGNEALTDEALPRGLYIVGGKKVLAH